LTSLSCKWDTLCQINREVILFPPVVRSRVYTINDLIAGKRSPVASCHRVGE
jgi:hypothetical protein